MTLAFRRLNGSLPNEFWLSLLSPPTLKTMMIMTTKKTPSASLRAAFVALLLTTTFLVAQAQTTDPTSQSSLSLSSWSCRLITFLPFTDLREGPEEPHANPNQYGYGNYRDEAEATEHARNLLAAAEMARQDFVSSYFVSRWESSKNVCLFCAPSQKTHAFSCLFSLLYSSACHRTLATLVWYPN